MKVHEYQAKSLLRSYNVSVPRGVVASTPKEAYQKAQELGGNLWAVKAQIHAGGRGKGGGVVLCSSLEEVEKNAKKLIGSHLITPQTSKEGAPVDKVYIEMGCGIREAMYLSFLVDRDSSSLSIVSSSEGGMDIEEVAGTNPEKILTTVIAFPTGLCMFHSFNIAHFLGIPHAVKILHLVLRRLVAFFMEKDLALLEINPLALLEDGSITCLDAKIIFDENALYRHQDILSLHDPRQEDEAEAKAQKYNISYVRLDGEVGCMVNGAGLAMATADILHLYGAEAANFLDVGGGASKEKIIQAFHIILSDKNVHGLLVNIFGGIMRCDIIAEGIVQAAESMDISIPIVVRLEGTNAEKGQKILQKSSLNSIFAKTFEEVAIRTIEALGKTPKIPNIEA